MKNKKGFTLIEILTTIVILSIIILIAVPTYSNISKKTKNNIYNTKIDSIKTAAEFYAKDINVTAETTITVGDLLDNGYLDKESTCSGSTATKDMCDPRDNTSMREKTITLTPAGKGYNSTINK